MFMDIDGYQFFPINFLRDLKSIFLKKTSYKFVNSVIQEVRKSSENPLALNTSLGMLETECVYEVVFKS